MERRDYYPQALLFSRNGLEFATHHEQFVAFGSSDGKKRLIGCYSTVAPTSPYPRAHTLRVLIIDGRWTNENRPTAGRLFTSSRLRTVTQPLAVGECADRRERFDSPRP